MALKQMILNSALRLSAVRNERISLCADRHDDSDRSVETWKR